MSFPNNLTEILVLAVIFGAVGAISTRYKSVKLIKDAAAQRQKNLDEQQGQKTVITDDQHWADALAEFESDKRKAGLWARVFSEAQGNETLAKANYLKTRAGELRDEQVANTPVNCPACGKLNSTGTRTCINCNCAM